MNDKRESAQKPGISRERYDWLNKVKYARDLTVEEMEDYLSWNFSRILAIGLISQIL